MNLNKLKQASRGSLHPNLGENEVGIARNETEGVALSFFIFNGEPKGEECVQRTLAREHYHDHKQILKPDQTIIRAAHIKLDYFFYEIELVQLKKIITN